MDVLKCTFSHWTSHHQIVFFFPDRIIDVTKSFHLYLLFCYLFIFFQCSALCKFVNKAADAGITALHMAALNGYFDCVQLLLDLHANVSAVTFHYGTSMDLIGMLCAYVWWLIFMPLDHASN